MARAIIAVLTAMFGIAAASLSLGDQLALRVVPFAWVASASTVFVAAAWLFCPVWPSPHTSITFVAYADLSLAVILTSMKAAADALPLCSGFAIVSIFVVVGTFARVATVHTAFSGVTIAVIGVRAIAGGGGIWVITCWLIAVAGAFAGPVVLKAYVHHLRRWAHRALHDPLTGLLNARGLSQALDDSNHANGLRAGTQPQSIGVTIIDIDHFSKINEKLGYDEGDAALVDVALRLRRGATADTLVARLGSDQFASVHVGTAESVSSAEQRMRAWMDEPFTTPPFTTSAWSAGPVTIAAGDRSSGIVRRLLAAADIELGRRKAGNGADSRFHRPPEPAFDVVGVRERIRSVIATGGLTPVFQPICDARTRSVLGYEALTRFPPGHGSPLMWFRDATEAGIGSELESAAIVAALDAASSLPAQTFLSLNVSATTLLTTDVMATLRGRTDRERLCVEITEHDRFDDYRSVAAVIDDLRGAGLRVAIDDVGAGFASLRLVVECQPDIIKIDYELTRGIDSDQRRRAGAAALVTFAHSIAATTVMEGIETEGECAVAVDLGVDMIQGFLTGRPASAN